ncbi:MAG: WG repeat-containing protein [Butyrivibrio sp.]|nr:WG repeat-containing protein [Butyrivibrio sp.]
MSGIESAKRKKIIGIFIIAVMLILLTRYLVVGIRKPGYYVIDENLNVINSGEPFYYEPGAASKEGYILGDDIFSSSMMNTDGDFVDGPDDSLIGRNFGEDGFFKTYKGFYDKDFNLVIEIKYKEGDEPCIMHGEAPKSFASNGLAAVQVYRKIEKYHDPVALWGYVDRTGEFVIEPQYTTAEDFGDNGYALVETLDDVFVFIDEKGNEVSKKYCNASTFSKNGLAFVYEEDSKRAGYVNGNFEYVIEGDYYSVEKFADNNMAAVSREKGLALEWGFINEKGELCIDYKFRDVQYGGFINGYCVVWKCDEAENTWGFIDEKGELVIKVPRKPHPFADNGLALVQGENGLYGYMRTDGTWFLKPQFEKATDFSNGYAGVWLSKYQIIKK